MAEHTNNTKQRKWPRRLLNALIVLLLVAGLGLIFNKSIRNFFMAGQINKYQVSNYNASQIKANEKKKATFDFKQVKPVDFSSVFNSQWKAQDFPVIGGISIPDVKINLPIFKGVDTTQLLYGAGTMKESQQMGKGNYALASHHVFDTIGGSAMLFSPLTDAKVGMKIFLTDKTNLYEYQISNVYTVDPNAGYVIDDPSAGKPAMITLVTCTDLNADGRIIVQGDFVKQTPFDKASQTIVNGFNEKYNQFRG